MDGWGMLDAAGASTGVYLIVLAACLFGIALILFGGKIKPPWAGARRRLPVAFDTESVTLEELPGDTREPVEYLTETLVRLGFEPADMPARLPELQSLGYRLFVVPFLSREEMAFFILGIEADASPSSQLLLHIITPLSDGRRVETTTLQPLDTVTRPPKVDAQVVLDASSIEEIWSRHRLALTRYERAEREVIEGKDWRRFAAAAYGGWLQMGVRMQRLKLEKSGRTYRVKSPPRSPF